MAKLVKPVLFSQHFGLSASELEKAGFIDPILNSDTPLFIDPLLLSTSANAEIKKRAPSLVNTRFEQIIRLVAASETTGDAAWRAAAKFLDLSERRETGLGYGGASRSGASRPQNIKQQVLATAREIVKLGAKDPEIIPLMGLFEEGVGPDTISDLTTNIIKPVLCSITDDFCSRNGIATKRFASMENVALPQDPFDGDRPILLVPKDILRDLPIANDWSEVSQVVLQNEQIRDAFNRFLGPITKATLGQKKAALKRAILSSADALKLAIAALEDATDSYDPNEDIFNFYAFRKILSSDTSKYAGKISKPTSASSTELKRVVGAIVEHFKFFIEKNNGWEMLWNGDKPKRERAAQLLFFAIADVYCRENDSLALATPCS